MRIDVDELRKDLLEESYGAFFGGGLLIESFDIEGASSEELVELAERKGIDLYHYTVDD